MAIITSLHGVTEMRVLVLCDDHWHPASTVRQGLSPLAGQGYDFEFCADGREWSAGHMDSFPLVILAKSNNVTAADDSPWITDEVEAAFQSYVARGNGLLVMHSGTVACQKRPILRAVVGGAFRQHPPQCDVTMAPHGAHPLTAGVAAFTMRDEHYQMELDDQNADVFLTSQSDSGVQPAGWARSEGAGRVCVLTPGHNVDVWLHPAFQALLGNALRWCSPNH